MIHHVSVGTNDLARARIFYDAIFGVIGMRLTMQDKISWHYGVSETCFSVIKPLDGARATVGHGSHIAFTTEHRDMVDEFYRAALSHGGMSDGPPGLRPAYDKNYYAAFVRDPDGNKIELYTSAAG